MMLKCSWSCLILSFFLRRLLVPGNKTTTGSLDLDYMGFLIIGSEIHSVSSQHSSKNNEDYDQTLILGSPLANAQVRKISHSDWSVQVMLGFSGSNQ